MGIKYLLLDKTASLKAALKDRRTIDYLNIALILLTCVLAQLFPYTLLLASYGILGPAHYLTQISWLHDRNYFAKARYTAVILGLLTVLLLLTHNNIYSTMILTAAIGGAVAFTLSPHIEIGIWGIIIGAITGAWISHDVPPAALFILILLPTVLHIFVFTAGFMWVGATKSGDRISYLAILVLVVSAATFLTPGTTTPTPTMNGLSFFQPVVDYMNGLLPKGMGNRLFGFLAFAYTYHYLNWFSKAEVIRWNRISRQRLTVIIALYIIFEVIYFYDFSLGFLLVSFLSILHILLEFPLNVQTFGAIGTSLRSGFKRRTR